MLGLWLTSLFTRNAPEITKTNDKVEYSDETIVHFSAHFESAAQHLQSVANQLDPDSLLYLYARYKQATEGPCTNPPPGIFDLKLRRKYAIWKSLGNKSKVSAQREYIDKIRQLDPQWNPDTVAKRTFGPRPSRPVIVDDESGYVEDSRWFLAVKEADVDTLVRLVDEEPGLIACADDQLMTALHWAADRGDLRMVSLLIDKGASIQAVDSQGQTALDYAVSCDHKELVKMLSNCRP